MAIIYLTRINKEALTTPPKLYDPTQDIFTNMPVSHKASYHDYLLLIYNIYGAFL